MKSTLLILAFFFASTYSEGYYWREYFGTIPEDAFVAGYNNDGSKVYIGQGHYVGHGAIPGNIVPGKKEVPVNWGHVTLQSKLNKILCGSQQNFYWMKANGVDLHLRLLGKHAVIGGHNNQYYINIGRVSDAGNTQIGKIDSFVTGDAAFYFNDNSKRRLLSYEILMYHNFQIDERFGGGTCGGQRIYAHEGYYWREYFGTIPDDAIIAGKNYNGQNVYIGLGTYIGHGFITGNIKPGVLEVPVNWGHVIQMSKFNKILCGIQEKFYWMTGNSTHLHVQVVGKHPVITDQHDVYLNVGRVAEGAGTQVGKIDAWNIGDAAFFFNDNSGRKVNLYEVLMYK